jgi:hypothetical protein
MRLAIGILAIVASSLGSMATASSPAAFYENKDSAPVIKNNLLLAPEDSVGPVDHVLLQKRTAMEAPLTMTPNPGQSQHESFSQSHRPSTHVEPTSAPPNIFKRCHESKDACTSSTSSCSSHGECAEASTGCWSCVCKPSVLKLDGGRISTTYWAGTACQKKDISVPFNLFLLFTIASVVVVGWAIGLLFSIGEAELPSVLSAGVAPTKS